MTIMSKAIELMMMFDRLAERPKDIATGERIEKEELSKPIKDFLEENQKEEELLEISRKESKRQRDERKQKEKSESEKSQEELEPIYDANGLPYNFTDKFLEEGI